VTRLPIIPFLIVVTFLAAAIYLFNSTGGDRRVLDAPRLSRIADVEGVETEVALSPDGRRCAVVADGHLWLVNLPDISRFRLTESPEPESFPAWTPDGQRLAFTRGHNTLIVTPDGKGTVEPFRQDATNLSWSATGRIAYVRNRGLWLTDVSGKNDKQIVPPDENENVTIHSPRFSPDSLQIAFVKSLLSLSGEVWTVDLLNGIRRPLVADRAAENPFDVGWIMDGRELVYLTDRSGAYSLWHINFADNTIMPLTQPLLDMPLAPIGFTVWKDRLVLPRHFVESDIELSDGVKVTQTGSVATDPAVSPDGRIVAYTIRKDNKTEIWTAGIDGSNPVFRTNGYEPHFTADGFHVVYTHTDLTGNDDIWRLDIRTGDTERLTDAEELDITPDTSADGRSIAFTSTRSIAPSIWILAASGGKRLRLNDGGYGPRFSADSKSILYWNKGAFWTMNPDGTGIQGITMQSSSPAIGGWLKSTPLQIAGNQIVGVDQRVLFKSDRPLWPRFAVMPDGRFLVAPIDIRETGLWAIDLQYKK